MPATYTNVPPVSGNTAWLNSLLRAALGRVVRFGIFSDSRFTAIGGAGTNVYRFLARNSYARYGNVPETQVGSFGYSAGAFLINGNDAEGRGLAVPIAANTVPPGIWPVKIQYGGAGPIAAFTFRDKTAADAGAVQTLKSNMMNFPLVGISAKQIRARIFAIAEPGSTEPSDILFPKAAALSYFDVPTYTGVGAFGVNDTLGLIKQQTFTFPYGGANDALDVLSCWPSMSAGTANMMGIRWENPDAQYGITFHSVSAGGYQTTSFIANHAACGPMLNAIGLDAGIILFGANDYGLDVTAAAKRDNTIAMIRAVRATMNNPTFPFILLSDVYRTGLTVPQLAEWAQDAGAMAEAAASESFCVALNLQRATYQGGLNADNAGWEFVDGVHWNEVGASTVGTEIVSLMFSGMGGDFTDADRADLAYIKTQAALIRAQGVENTSEDALALFGAAQIGETDVRYVQTFNLIGLPSTGWTAITFTIKADLGDEDADALLTVRVSNPAVGTDGIIWHRGKVVDVADALRLAGSIVVIATAPDTTITVTIKADGMNLPPSPDTLPFAYEINVWIDGDKQQFAKGDFTINQSVRRSTAVP